MRVIELAAPKFNDEVPASFNLTEGTLWSYQYPSITDGTLAPY